MPVIAHNMLSQFANRQLNITDKNKSRSSEKLSSGYRINRAADDAAGLAISEKLRWQVRGLKRASANISDGISLCQVAEGALHEDHAILQRMRELSIQAASDTNTDKDRQAIQWEIEALAEEVDRVAENTEFNKEIFPLKGSLAANGSMNSALNIRGLNYNLSATRITISASSGTIDGQPVAGKTVSVNTIQISEMNNSQNIVAYVWDVAGVNPSDISHRLNLVDSSYSLLPQQLMVDEEGYVYFESRSYKESGYSKTKAYIFVSTDASLNFGFSNYKRPLGSDWEYVKGEYINNNASNQQKDSLWIQMGAKSGQGMYLSLVDATAKGIGLTDPPLDVASFENASNAITRLEAAIDKVSAYRSTFGAQQNRLEHGKTLDDLTAENSQAAESRIRDTDMAAEMISYSKHSILQQAGQSMLSQANQLPKVVLRLLQ